ncbi:MAG: RNA polymerase sigma-70 factor [Cytophagales bacterium]|nr:RNA polymerase sigma-70 factor [Cytophagales bacterium]
MLQAQIVPPSTQIDELSNEELFEVIKESGDYVAFEKLYKRFYYILTHYAYRYMKCPELANDMVSEVFYKLWKKRDSISVTTSLQSYLFTAVRNRCLDQLRVENRVDKCDDSVLIDLDSSSSTPLQHAIAEELQQKIENAIEALPKDRRKVFRMSRDNGLKYKEIADTLGISIKTVETQMGRALKFLRGELTEYINV